MNRERQARWDRENLWSVGTKLAAEQYRMIRRACDVEGVSMYALVKHLLMDWLTTWAAEHPDRAREVMDDARR